MKKIMILTFIAVSFMFFAACTHEPVTPETEDVPQSDTTALIEEPTDVIYQFSVLDGYGDSVSLASYKGNVLLVINSATQCGYTPQYTKLQKLYETYQDRGFVILDFPCNQFGNQAPGDYEDIHGYCTDHYNITFPQFAKIIVNGPNASPLYVWLKSKKPGNISWNFTKFLINKKGEVVECFEPASINNIEGAIIAELEK